MIAYLLVGVVLFCPFMFPSTGMAQSDAEYRGILEAITATTVTVDGQTFVFSPDAKVDEGLELGDCVELETDADGYVKELEKEGECRT